MHVVAGEVCHEDVPGRRIELADGRALDGIGHHAQKLDLFVLLEPFGKFSEVLSGNAGDGMYGQVFGHCSARITKLMLVRCHTAGIPPGSVHTEVVDAVGSIPSGKVSGKSLTHDT